MRKMTDSNLGRYVEYILIFFFLCKRWNRTLKLTHSSFIIIIVHNLSWVRIIQYTKLLTVLLFLFMNNVYR